MLWYQVTFMLDYGRNLENKRHKHNRLALREKSLSEWRARFFENPKVEI